MAPLANDRAKAVRFGFALVSYHVRDYGDSRRRKRVEIRRKTLEKV